MDVFPEALSSFMGEDEESPTIETVEEKLSTHADGSVYTHKITTYSDGSVSTEIERVLHVQNPDNPNDLWNIYVR